MDIKIIGDDGKESQETSEVASHGEVVGDITGQMEMKAIGQVLGLERESEIGQNKEKIQTLLDYAKSQTTDHSPENLKWAIRSLELKLGTPPFSEKRINYVTRYAYLYLEGERIRKEKEKFEHN